MVQTPIKLISLETFLKLPETKPVSEYIDGQVIQKPMPKGKHSVIQTELAAEINYVLKKKRIAWAFNELRCTFSGQSLVPDISVFQWSKIPLDRNGEIANSFELAPDWTIEILSPEQSHIKVTKNILYCLEHGTQLGWLIDPQEQSVLVYAPSQQVKIFDKADNLIVCPPFADDFQLTVKDLFSWLIVNPNHY
jgi:Uma2 family endonuclease